MVGDQSTVDIENVVNLREAALRFFIQIRTQ
jgi:hypothetical protein